ncbi:uncharacterized protein LOC121303110 isoform X2 [Polyodon spathula]|nr:uncharacterized protein LOC121303110 isoform X2 [Polyodon spathula]XP_041089507.1 uncharacterized protein LOC121303110 isoform X2 [Polyodon spathula]XP_041089508.1 uncharacterized protein LOC121303110 isoform X2 [Polyodon spathula]XP_041089509.1 uncharacterized protein LOC121303110 isoform X2 [Polyodon spathula]XP_041089510.1 uncharacterized protein LOC121303110 isoform X2 [Polyodon spathula]XP_041089511.1 uncharacterized protein LOC121303110 isoform X2 [Polyodon spathula]XP_041089513.1 un
MSQNEYGYYRILTSEDSRLLRPQEMKFSGLQLVADDSIQSDDLKLEYLLITTQEYSGNRNHVTLLFHCVPRQGFYYLCCTDSLELVPKCEATPSEPKYKFKFEKHANDLKIESVNKAGWFLQVEGRKLKIETGKELCTLFQVQKLQSNEIPCGNTGTSASGACGEVTACVSLHR